MAINAGPEGHLQVQLLLGARRGLRERRQQRQPLREVPDGFLIPMPLERILRRLLEIRHRPRGVLAAHKVVR